jgi:hypothetical protein
MRRRVQGVHEGQFDHLQYLVQAPGRKLAGPPVHHASRGSGEPSAAVMLNQWCELNLPRRRALSCIEARRFPGGLVIPAPG